VAVGGRYALTYDGTTWTSTRLIPSKPRFVRLTSASCVSAGFCLVADDIGNVYRYDGSAWSGPTQVMPIKVRSGSDQATCANEHLCTMVNTNGMASEYDGATWSEPERIDPPGHDDLSAVDCGHGTFCMAVDYHGYAIPYNAF
jgi:hypothetical protein